MNSYLCRTCMYLNLCEQKPLIVVKLKLEKPVLRKIMSENRDLLFFNKKGGHSMRPPFHWRQIIDETEGARQPLCGNCGIFIWMVVVS